MLAAQSSAPKTYVVFLKPSGFSTGLGEDRFVANRRESPGRDGRA